LSFGLFSGQDPKTAAVFYLLFLLFLFSSLHLFFQFFYCY